MAGAAIRQFPDLMKPMLGPLFSMPAHLYQRRYEKLLIPEILRRQQLYSGALKEQKPNDFLQWQIDRGSALGIPIESDPKTISARLLATNFAAIHTSTFSITQTIFDLVASSPSVLDALREESRSALAATGNEWSKATLQLLIKHDSTLRESTRLGSFLSVGMLRRVVEPDGLVAPNGTFCPYDSWVGIASNGVHNDPGLYSDSDKFRPFRFSDMREAEVEAEFVSDEQQSSSKESEREVLIKKANLSFVSVSPQYHPFGHGRHACPGRFFAANELKLLLAYMIQNYDFEMLDTRPPSQWIGAVLVPPRTATIRIRRREQAS
jgi:cytochrome P450